MNEVLNSFFETFLILLLHECSVLSEYLLMNDETKLCDGDLVKLFFVYLPLLEKHL